MTRTVQPRQRGTKVWAWLSGIGCGQPRKATIIWHKPGQDLIRVRIGLFRHVTMRPGDCQER